MEGGHLLNKPLTKLAGEYQIDQKEKEAVVRMMVYIRRELTRLKMDKEASYIEDAISIAENRLKDSDEKH